MTLETFTPSIAPSPGNEITNEVSIHEASFGDGYTQASPNGLNHMRYELTLRWAGITPDQLEELDGFFRRHGGIRPFVYAAFGIAGEKQWTCREWGTITTAPLSFRAKLRQDFRAG